MAALVSPFPLGRQLCQDLIVTHSAEEDLVGCIIGKGGQVIKDFRGLWLSNGSKKGASSPILLVPSHPLRFLA